MQSPILNRFWVRELDRLATAQYRVPSIVLMENAGRGAADILCELGAKGPVGIFCGRGNNGGDGFVVARHLDLRGIPVRLVSLVPSEQYQGDALVNAQIAKASGLPWSEFHAASTAGTIDTQLAEELAACDWIVDAMLGTGAQGILRSPHRELVPWCNALDVNRLALDIPTGLDCDTGSANDPTFRAHHTVTFAAYKPGLLVPEAKAYTGQLHLADIGVPRVLLESCVEAYQRAATARAEG
jgi:NAD(P)H-hydrate epimerase